MKHSSKLFLVGALALSLFAAAFALQPGLAASENHGPALQDATLTATPSTDSSGTNDSSTAAVTQEGTPTAPKVQVWDQFCVKKIPYTLLAVPENATFEMAQSDGTATVPTVRPGYSTTDPACESAGVFRGQQVIVCRGPNLWSFNITISDGGDSAVFPVPLKDCPLPKEQPTATSPA